jgi:hypothetical protein
MRTRSTHGPRRVRRAASVALSCAAVVLTIGTLGVLGAAPAQAMDNGRPPVPLIVSLAPVFVVQPTTTKVNEPVTPPVTVAVDTFYGQLATWYHGPVMLQYAVNPDSANLPTWNVAFAVGGIATFPNLTFSSVGSGFQLVALAAGTSAGPIVARGGPSPPSCPFDIVGHRG